MPVELKEWWPLVMLLTPLVIAAIIWAIRKGLASKDDLATEARARNDAITDLDKRIGERLAALNDRTLRIETDIKHLPTAEDITDLKERLAHISGAIEGSAREVQSMSRALNRVEDRLGKGVA